LSLFAAFLFKEERESYSSVYYDSTVEFTVAFTFWTALHACNSLFNDIRCILSDIRQCFF